MNAMTAMRSDPFELEARAYCARHGLSADASAVAALAGSLRQDAIRREVEPWTKIKLAIYSTAIPKLVIDAAGHIESTYEFSAEAQKVLDECDKAIAETGERYRAAANGSAAAER